MNIKKKYTSPKINSIQVDLEESIAAGSARALSGNSSDQVKEEWIQDDTDYRVIEW